MEQSSQIEEFLQEIIEPSFRGHLLSRGVAWSMMRVDGQLPEDAKIFASDLENDLADYGFSILGSALTLHERGSSNKVVLDSFETAAKTFECLCKNAGNDDHLAAFYRVISAAAYHLAGFSAIAYSLFNLSDFNQNYSPAESALVRLIMRDLNGLREFSRSWLQDENNSDQSIVNLLEEGEFDSDDAIACILNVTVCKALSYFDFALQTGDEQFIQSSKFFLEKAKSLAGNAAVVSQWWIIRLCACLISDLWAHSLHENLPQAIDNEDAEAYETIRKLFISCLYARKNSEVELWPSQREAAKRSADLNDDLVVALPTSAGKTRVAEIAAMMTLSIKKRVLIVTPLRALSAQTERSFRRTFSPLGFTVSSLYGAAGTSSSDQDALKSDNIVITTPEKLDFALRSEPDLINDVGLVILDEGHMIGPTEREIRYEVLVQKLLRRVDADGRRIVCLSAILPPGEQLEDFSGWLRKDKSGDAVQSTWRPTRQRFGLITWYGDAVKLNYDLNDNGPFLSRFCEPLAARGLHKSGYPREVKDLTVISAWKFAEQGKKVLIFVTQANWVQGFGDMAVDLCKRGYLHSLVENQQDIQRAVAIGEEWLGSSHPVIEALKIGIAVHHGKLPSPFLRELELLLAKGAIKVTVASPTLSQGLNINAAVLLVPYLVRSGEMISGEEFANVAGRAGRAFVDVEGLICHVVTEKHSRKIREWKSLVAATKSRTLQSGLTQIVLEILKRLYQNGILNKEDAFEYLANSREGWIDENPNEDESTEESLEHLVEKLDAMVLGLVEALDSNSEDLPRLLDEALKGSLWARQLSREEEGIRTYSKELLDARSRFIWSKTTAETRKGYYAMGVGLESGLAIDGMADELNILLDEADVLALGNDADALAAKLIELGKRLLSIRPFAPNNEDLPDNWEHLLKLWVSGVDVELINIDNMKIIEDLFVYRLVWALEALRTKRISTGWSAEVITGGAAATVETGTPTYMMAMLIQSGLPSRRAAIRAITETDALFTNVREMKEWLQGNQVTTLTNSGSWPTSGTSNIWAHFRNEMLNSATNKWVIKTSKRAIDDSTGFSPKSGVYRVENDNGELWVCTPDYKRLVKLQSTIRDPDRSLFSAQFIEGDNRAHILRIGSKSAIWETDS